MESGNAILAVSAKTGGCDNLLKTIEIAEVIEQESELSMSVPPDQATRIIATSS